MTEYRYSGIKMKFEEIFFLNFSTWNYLEKIRDTKGGKIWS